MGQEAKVGAFDGRTDDSLIGEARGLYDCLFVVDCFGVSDCIRYELVCRELECRGYEIGESRSFRATKTEGEDE